MIPEKQIFAYQVVAYFALMLLILTAGLLGAFGLQGVEDKNLQITTYILGKVLGYDFAILLFAMSIPFFKKNCWIFTIFIIIGLAFFTGTTTSILFPAPYERPF
jgi:uncharacterized membrane protein YgdD (TMEM256/DUF423 family)